MSNTKVLRIVSVALLLAAPGLATGQEPAWELSFKTFSRRFILAEPIWARVAVTNASGKEVPRAGLYGDLYLDGAKKACRPVSGPNRGPETIPGGEGDSSRPAAPAGEEVSAWLNLSHECNLTRGGASPVGSHSVCYRDNASTDLLSNSSCLSFEVRQPEGVDKEAYEAFGHNPLGDSERWGELLRRFPTSTYAAYLVWTRWGRVTAGVWKTAGDRDKFLAWLSGDPDQEYLTWNLPCAEDGRTDGAVTTRLGGRKALACRDRWLELVLDHHPDIWFADEVLLRLALDRYRLADKDACAAGLEELADHGRPDVASKASEVLSAMKAKGMLAEKRK